jgi:cobalt/nickel transport system permease protein
MLLSPAQMHIPDGFLSVLVSAMMWLLTVIVVGYALKRAGKDLNDRQVPLMGVLAAAIFAGQMLNFTVAGGTSGHLMGAAIATILLGPWPAVLVMTCVVAVQALIFQDGGLLVLGSNIFNMGIIGVAVAYTTYQTISKLAGKNRWGIYAAGFIAAWLSIVIASLAVALQLALSGTSPANIAIPAMFGIHALIGIGEGLITLGALAFITATRPDLLKLEGKAPVAGKLVWAVGLLLTLALVILSPLASAHPDGLEWVAEQQGFLSSSKAPLYSIIPDYLLPGITNEALATILAGIIGALIVFVVMLSVAFLRRKGQQPQ